MAKHRIRSLATTLDGAVVVAAVELEGGETLLSSSSSIQMTLAAALALNSEIDVETIARSQTIRRILAFDARPSTLPGTISRLATQRNGETGIDFLEVFVRK